MTWNGTWRKGAVAIREILDGLRGAVVFNERVNQAWKQMERLAASLDRLDQDHRDTRERLVRVETALDLGRGPKG
jgi:hypothetical protein